MSCVPLEPGSLTITDGADVVALSCEAGFVVLNFQIGWPSERPVVRQRSLADGLIDDSRFLGGRAVTITVALDQRVRSTQALLDTLTPLMSPRRRPTITWSLAGSPDDLRSLVVRGVDLPVAITGAKFQTFALQFLAADPLIRGPELECTTMSPSEGEVGRTYDLDFDRDYPPAGPSGSRNVRNNGSTPAPWTGTIFGEVDDPVVTINGVDVAFTGLTLTGSQTLVIDVEAKTILLDGDPGESRYDLSNYTEWDWDDLLLQPGDNQVRLTGDDTSASTALTICLYPRWLA